MARLLIVITLAFIASRIIFAVVGFSYSPFGDPLSLPKLAIDFGVWAVCYIVASWVVRPRKPPTVGP
jgi:hypothetical protein